MSTIEEQQFVCNPYPPNSPDLAPSDFYVFDPLKDALSGTQFRDDDEVRSAVHEWLRTLRKNYFPAESTRLSGAGVSALN
jgi:hypothetical protein